MTKLVCKNTDSDTAIRFPSCPKANIVCSQQAFRLKSSLLNYGNGGCPGFSPEFPCLRSNINFLVYPIVSQKAILSIDKIYSEIIYSIQGLPPVS